MSEIVRQSDRSELNGRNERSDRSDRNGLSDRKEPNDQIGAALKAAIENHAVAIVTREIRTVTAVIVIAIGIVTVVAGHARGKDPDGKH